jgi:hypothetical protein
VLEQKKGEEMLREPYKAVGNLVIEYLKLTYQPILAGVVLAPFFAPQASVIVVGLGVLCCAICMLTSIGIESKIQRKLNK